LGIDLLLLSLVKGKLQSIYVGDNGIFFSVSAMHLNKLLRFLRDSRLFQFKSLLDLWSVDFLTAFVAGRFQLNYNLLSVFFLRRIFIRSFISYPFVTDTISNLYSGALWLEREVWDMMGIFFSFHLIYGVY